MKNTTLADMPTHQCSKPGSPWLGFAEMDLPTMKSLAERDASKEEISAQVNAWIAADAAQNPHPSEPVDKRFQAALLANVPFAVYCGQCRQVLCLVHPEQIEEGDVANEQKNDLTPTAKDEAIEDRVQELRSELGRLGRFGIVFWMDSDLIEALENAGAAPTAENIATLREYVQDIDDEMTVTGWRVIEEAINDLGLVPPSAPGKAGE